MDNVDLGRHLAQHPNVSRLKLVSGAFSVSATIPSLIPFSSARRDFTWTEIYAQPRCRSWKRKDGGSSGFVHRHGLFTFFQRNVLVDNDGVSRLGGLGSAFSLSLPASWSDVESERLFCGIAPELIDPHAFGFVHARPTKATDMFGFGMLAWEVSCVSSAFGSLDVHPLVFASGSRRRASVRQKRGGRSTPLGISEQTAVAACPS